MWQTSCLLSDIVVSHLTTDGQEPQAPIAPVLQLWYVAGLVILAILEHSLGRLSQIVTIVLLYKSSDHTMHNDNFPDY